MVLLVCLSTIGYSQDKGTFCATTDPDRAVITKINGDTLSSSVSAGNQWYLNGIMISGAIHAKHKPTMEGNYVVRVTDANGCTNESDAFLYSKLNFVEGLIPGSKQKLNAYPNPFSHEIVISFTLEQNENIQLELLDFTGRIITVLIKDEPYTIGCHELRLAMSQYGLKRGVYLIKLSKNDATEFFRMNYTN